MTTAFGSWIDGVAANTLPADDRGLHYGDGLFETLLIRAGRARFLETHLARLMLGCSRLGIRFQDLDALRRDIEAATRQALPLAVLKILVTRGSALRRGYAPSGDEKARRLVSLWAADPIPPSIAQGADAIVSELRVAQSASLAGIKHLNRLENVLAAAEAARLGAFEALLLNAAGNVVSGAMSNVFGVYQGRVFTPAQDGCGVAGVMRGLVLREAAGQGIEIEQRPVTLPELAHADEAFITNARIGVVPLRRLGEHSFHMNTIGSRLRAHLEALDA